MNKVILCEGGTDAILLSYYLGKVSEWKYCRKPPKNNYRDSFNTDQWIESLLVAIPTEHQGALETILLDSISEDPYDAVIVKKAGAFVKKLRAEASRYLVNPRAELKAHLGVTWAIQYPEKVFKLINQQIQSVHWEKSEILHRCFEQLILI